MNQPIRKIICSKNSIVEVIRGLLFIIIATQTLSAYAVTGVNPSGVNVRHTGATTVFLTFQNLDVGEVSSDSFWCGAVTNTGVSSTNPCIPGTIFGHLPARQDLSRQSSTGGARNFTDIMTIPATVSRRAYQDARRGNNATFFYVRRFTGGLSGDRFVTVTCRMAGGGARSPLSLIDVRIGFITKNVKKPVYLVKRGELPEKFSASILYTGTGQLKGRWEIKLPSDPEPSANDLLTEASLPIELRSSQKKYTLLARFSKFLPPTGKVIIRGPDPRLLPTNIDGAYKILFRVEATNDKEGNSNTLSGIVRSGGVAGFSMPVLRYYVGSEQNFQNALSTSSLGDMRLVLPNENAKLTVNEVIEFSWTHIDSTVTYHLEVVDASDAIISAVLRSNSLSYLAPPWINKHINKPLRWRVKAIDREGLLLAISQWRSFTIGN